MNLTAFLLILVSVFMHAAWNFLGKKESPSSAFFFIAAVAGALFCLPFVFFSGVDFFAIPAKFWYILIASVSFNLIYFFALASGYRCGDISLVYPLGRSLPVLLTAGVTMLLNIGGKPLSVNALIGMAVLFIGCVILPLQKWSDFKIQTYFSKVIFWVLFISFGATGYTILDSLDMTILKTVSFSNGVLRAIFFQFAAEVLISFGMFWIVIFSARERTELKRIARSYAPWLAGVFTASAYILVLLAMNQVSNVCYIQAFRQMSLPVGMLAGVFILKESCSMPKIIGIILIVSGLVMTSF
jgi:drug/metabolite transporter (DMT)-like permease